MTEGEKYRAIVKCADEYRFRMPDEVSNVSVVETGRSDYPEIIEIRYKDGTKSAIGNPKMVAIAKPLVGDIKAFAEAVKAEVQRQIEELRPAAQKEACESRSWTYVLCVLDSNGGRVGRYSWIENNSWELYGMTDREILDSMIDSCRRFRSESTDRWHVYRRMRGKNELTLVY